MPIRWEVPADAIGEMPGRHGGDRSRIQGRIQRRTKSPKPVSTLDGNPLPDHWVIHGCKVRYEIPERGWSVTRAFWLCPQCGVRCSNLYLLREEPAKVGCRRHLTLRQRKQLKAERAVRREERNGRFA